MEIDLESRRPFRLAGQPPPNTALEAPAPEVVATMRAAARRNAEYAAARAPKPSPRRLGEALAEPTADVRSARGRCAQLAIDGVRRRAEAAQLRKELGQPAVADPTEEPALTPLVAGAKARAAKTRAYAEAISSQSKPAAPGVPITARVASLRKALPAPANPKPATLSPSLSLSLSLSPSLTRHGVRLCGDHLRGLLGARAAGKFK